ncbi:MAG: hypothetical protein HGA45_13535 [Chloroflexales bacterium]|nr:hypothetical protein [Chloroflexales bacterium]
MAKHKQKSAQGSTPQAKPVGGMAIAAGWPVHEVLLSRGWDQPHALAIVLIARRSPNSGKVAVASFLVDLSCLGVKSAQVRLHKDVAEYNAGLRAHIMGRQPMAPADLNLAAKIVLTGLEYADALGFKPDPVFAQAQPLLSGADIAACPTPVRTGGPEGKPFFINGPYDDVDKVIAQLRRAVGEGNFHYLIEAGPGMPSLLSDDDLG